MIKTRGPLGLKGLLLLLVVAFWVLPMLAALVASGVVAVGNTRHHVSDMVTVSVENAMGIIRRDLDRVVDDSMSVSYSSAIREAYSQYLRDGNPVAFNRAASAYLLQRFSRGQLVTAAYLVVPSLAEGSRIQAYNRTQMAWAEVEAFYGTQLYQDSAATLATLGSEVLFAAEEGRLYLLRALSLYNNTFAPYALLVLEVRTGTMLDSLNSLAWVTEVAVDLGSDGTVELGAADPARYPAAGAGNEAAALLEGDMLYLAGWQQAYRYTFGYRAAANLGPLITSMDDRYILVVLAAAFGGVLMVFLLLFIIFRINRPIQRLAAFAHRIEEGEIGAQCDTAGLGSAELAALGRAMNAMSARLKYQFERLYREELALRDAQMKALQSQINPHFLGNTLEIINWEARLAGNVKVSQMMEALSTILRATLDRGQRPMVHLSEEMMVVNAYLYIIGQRLGKRLEVRQELDDTLLDRLVPRLILQPLVENAVEHGVNQRQRGRIVIRARRLEGDSMRIEVENDAPLTAGDEARIAALLGPGEADGESSTNIGIRNVHRRLQLVYGPQSGLSIKSTKMGTTVSSICLDGPAHSQDNTR